MDILNNVNEVIINKLTEENEFLTVFVNELIDELGKIEEYYMSELSMRDVMIEQQREEIEALERKINRYSMMKSIFDKK